jgi:hypothetical protein
MHKPLPLIWYAEYPSYKKTVLTTLFEENLAVRYVGFPKLKLSLDKPYKSHP